MYDSNTGELYTPLSFVIPRASACRHDCSSCVVVLVGTGKVIHSMTAHLDAVTGLAIDPHGLYLLSGGRSPDSISSSLFLSPFRALSIPSLSLYSFPLLSTNFSLSILSLTSSITLLPPPQVMTDHYVSGAWTQRCVYRRSPLTVNVTTNPSTTWPVI